MMRDVLVIGGGPAGIAAAETLLSLGKNVTVLDSAPFVGGVPLELSCKGDVECTKCHVCMPRDAAARIRPSEELEVLSMASISVVAFDGGVIKIASKIAPRYVKPDACTACGKCVAACPVAGAIVAPPHGSIPNAPYIDRELCAHFTSKKCEECAKVCPTQAINFKERSKEASTEARSVIVAAGLEPINPSAVQHYGYGLLPDIVTSLDAERIISKYGELRKPSDGQRPKKLAMVQCAGSRTTKGGVEYCSKFCCKYGLRIARALVERVPDAQVDFLYMDLRTFEPRADALSWVGDRKNFMISQGVPAMIQKSATGKLAIRRTTQGDAAVEEGEYDMAVLTIGAQPRPETKLLATHLSLPQDSYGFITGDDPQRRIFVAGSCKAPMDIEESFSDGQSVAMKAAASLEARQ
jgi:heterodisulfide reductase subunit A